MKVSMFKSLYLLIACIVSIPGQTFTKSNLWTSSYTDTLNNSRLISPNSLNKRANINFSLYMVGTIATTGGALLSFQKQTTSPDYLIFDEYVPYLLSIGAGIIVSSVAINTLLSAAMNTKSIYKDGNDDFNGDKNRQLLIAGYGFLVASTLTMSFAAMANSDEFMISSLCCLLTSDILWSILIGRSYSYVKSKKKIEKKINFTLYPIINKDKGQGLGLTLSL